MPKEIVIIIVKIISSDYKTRLMLNMNMNNKLKDQNLHFISVNPNVRTAFTEKILQNVYFVNNSAQSQSTKCMAYLIKNIHEASPRL